MTLDPATLSQAKAELEKLLELGKINFEKETRFTKNFVFVGLKFSPKLYKWMKDQSLKHTKGNVNGFFRALLETLKEKEENTHHDHNRTGKRIPS